MKGAIKILNASGHTTVEFDTEEAESLAKAKEVLSLGAQKRSGVFDGQTQERIRDDPLTHEEVIIVPMMAGG